ncbi:LysE family translocator [Alteribacillus sp. YIM 98480]|uniref:LysE family translocator n=1 Tax=Alteribacillus sp. YIM 98480 TaxID=2606599 RepID=UPI00131BE467|nr:LysE family transporter [Alteribacillus sp. YIM 98480]
MINILVNGFILGFVASPTCPSNGEEIKQGTRSGFLFALSVGLGAVTGDAIILAAVLLGVMPVINTFPIVNSLLWLTGGVVLSYVSWGIFSEIKNIQGVSSQNNAANVILNKKKILQAYWAGTAITTFNPFTLVWWTGLLSPMMINNQNLTIFSLAVLAGSLAWFTILAIFLHAGRKYLNKRFLQIIITISGMVILGYSLYFFWQFISELIEIGGGN